MEDEIKNEEVNQEETKEVEDTSKEKDELFDSEFSKPEFFDEEASKSEEESKEEDVKEEEVVASDEDDEDEEPSKKGKRKKKKLTLEQKKKKRKKALIITAAVVMVIALFFSICAITNTVGISALYELGDNFTQVEYENQLVPNKDLDGYWTFTTNREFKIMQLTDVHIGGGCFSQTKDGWALNAVATMISQEKPDLVIVTGDIAYPVPFQAGTFNNLNATKVFANMMENLGVYWTFAFGNHDTEAYSMYSREDICEYYENAGFKYCLFQRGFSSEERGYGNTIIKIKNSAGLVTEALTILDSHSYIDGDYFGMFWKYDNLHQSQVDWYESEMKRIAADNKKINMSGPNTVKNLAFFHIPLVEYREAWKAYKENDNQDTDDVQFVYGNVGESDKNKNGVRTYGVYCGSNSDNFFTVGLANGLQGVFCGHDHYNNFSVVYKGIRLTYGMSIDYLAYVGIYKEHSQRGTTIITTNPINGEFDCQAKNYYADYNIAYERE